VVTNYSNAHEWDISTKKVQFDLEVGSNKLEIWYDSLKK